MPWRPALARPVPAGEEVPAADPRTVTSQTPAVNIVPTASNSGYEATCASYPATMTMKEGPPTYTRQLRPHHGDDHPYRRTRTQGEISLARARARRSLYYSSSYIVYLSR